MHTTLTRFRSLAVLATAAATLAPAVRAQQTTVDAVRMVVTPEQRAQILLVQGLHDSATSLLNNHLTSHPTDGRAWMYLGRIYLADAQRWHREGHPASMTPARLLDFASASFEPAQELLTDSGGMYRVIVAVERATLRVEQEGWDSVATMRIDAEDLPLPPVLAELGRNLLASCPANGVLLTGTTTEAAAVWATHLGGGRPDVILIRPDMYARDGRYRVRMAAKLGLDSAAALPEAMAAVAQTRPVCLGPSADSLIAPGLVWHASRLVLATAPPKDDPATPLTLFHFARTGLTGSVWTAAARDVYDLAARRNHEMCSTLFNGTDARKAPPIAACSP